MVQCVQLFAGVTNRTARYSAICAPFGAYRCIYASKDGQQMAQQGSLHLHPRSMICAGCALFSCLVISRCHWVASDGGCARSSLVSSEIDSGGPLWRATCRAGTSDAAAEKLQRGLVIIILLCRTSMVFSEFRHCPIASSWPHGPTQVV